MLKGRGRDSSRGRGGASAPPGATRGPGELPLWPRGPGPRKQPALHHGSLLSGVLKKRDQEARGRPRSGRKYLWPLAAGSRAEGRRVGRSREGQDPDWLPGGFPDMSAPITHGEQLLRLDLIPLLPLCPWRVLPPSPCSLFCSFLPVGPKHQLSVEGLSGRHISLARHTVLLSLTPSH